MKKIAIISDYSIQRQPRVITEINALKGHYEIILFGEESQLNLPFFKLKYFNNHPIIDFHFKWPISLRRLFSVSIRVYLFFYRLFKAVIKYFHKKYNIRSLTKQMPDLIILHGILHSNWVYKVSKKNKIPFIINLHEYYPLEFEDNATWLRDKKPLYDRYLKKYTSSANAYFVVCDSIIKKYKEEFGFKNQILVRNSKPFFNINPVNNSGSIIKMVHHGISNRSRKIELTIQMMKFLPDNYELDLMLVPDHNYYPELQKMAGNDKRIRFIPIVPTEQIIPFINSYDIGVFLLPPTNFNYLNALPNKLFEFIQARLAIVVTPNPEMKELVEKYNLGTVSKDYSPEEFARAILQINKIQIPYYKNNTDKAARIVNDETEQKKILQTVNSLLCAV